MRVILRAETNPALILRSDPQDRVSKDDMAPQDEGSVLVSRNKPRPHPEERSAGSRLEGWQRARCPPSSFETPCHGARSWSAETNPALILRSDPQDRVSKDGSGRGAFRMRARSWSAETNRPSS